MILSRGVGRSVAVIAAVAATFMSFAATGAFAQEGAGTASEREATAAVLDMVAAGEPEAGQTAFVAAPTETVPVRRSFFRRVGDYFKDSSRDRTLEKALDVTFIGGISYSKTTSLGFAVMAAGQYRVHRDPDTRPSNVSLFANVTLTGSYSVGIDGNTFFSDGAKMDYLLMFSSLPSAFWGIGYTNCDINPASSMVRRRVTFNARYLYPVAENLYIGGSADFNFTRATNYSASFLNPAYLPAGERTYYSATGVGVNIEYDSRDYVTEASKGIYVSVSEKIYPKGVGNCPNTMWSTTFTVDWYQQLWKGGTLAADLYGELRSAGTPWFLLSRLGGSYRMRGYYEGRYIDRNMITLQVELRQRIWRRIGCVVWGGAGNVFGREAFSWGHTLPNYGVGLRWQFKHRVNIRVDYGFGRRTSGLVLNINEAF